jgi:thiol-disulfide isomerase/thioredoxin
MAHPALTIFLALWTAAPASAATLEDAKDNADNIVQTYVAQLSGGSGAWEVQQRGTNKTLRLTFQSVDKKTVTALGADRFKVYAVFSGEDGQSRSYGEFDIDLGGADWKVDKMRWVNRRDMDAAVKAGEASAKKDVAQRQAAQVKARERKAETAAKRRAAGSAELLAEVDLPTLGSEDASPYYSCAAQRCVDVYVAPWCPHCKNVTPGILKLKEYLKSVGVPMRVTVGMDSEGPVLEYASTFGKDTMLDPGGKAKPATGVPNFCVYEDGGKVVKRLAGESDMSDPKLFAQNELGLP